MEASGSRRSIVRDMETGTTELISRAPAGRPGDAASRDGQSYPGDGSVIAYQSLASNLLCDDKCGPSESDINLLWDVYVYDRPTGEPSGPAATSAKDGWRAAEGRRSTRPDACWPSCHASELAA